MERRQTRSEARECAFSLIYKIEHKTDDREFVIEQLTEEKPECIINLPYIKESFFGVMDNIEALDEKITKVLPENRGFSRLSDVVKAILRLAVYEIFYNDDVPQKVAINEAVELAKKYAEDEAPSFVNGVLSGVIEK